MVEIEGNSTYQEWKPQVHEDIFYIINLLLLGPKTRNCYKAGEDCIMVGFIT